MVVASPDSGPRVDIKSILTVVGALVLPPIGIVLVAYWLFQKRNNGQSSVSSKLIAAAAAACLVGLAGYVYLISTAGSSSPNSPSGNSSANSASATANITLKSFKLPGAGANKGMTFQKPAEFARLGQTKDNTAIFANTTSPKGVTGGIVAAVNPVAGNYDPSFTLSQALSQPNSALYASYVASAEAFLKQETQFLFYPGGSLPAVGLNVSKPQAFSSANLESKNTWSFNYSASYYAVPNQPLPSDLSVKPSGQMILAYKSGVYYYFIIGHQSGPISGQTWQAIIDSLKIAQ